MPCWPPISTWCMRSCAGRQRAPTLKPFEAKWQCRPPILSPHGACKARQPAPPRNPRSTCKAVPATHFEPARCLQSPPLGSRAGCRGWLMRADGAITTFHDFQGARAWPLCEHFAAFGCDPLFYDECSWNPFCLRETRAGLAWIAQRLQDTLPRAPLPRCFATASTESLFLWSAPQHAKRSHTSTYYNQEPCIWVVL